jgi:hypothetical protein
MAIEVFQVEWTKLLRFDRALTQSVAQEGGIYAMYVETPRIYQLHYIGKSKDFYKRSGTHRNSASHLMTEAQQKKCFISFGLISCFEKSRMSHDITPEQLRDIESFFINEFKPHGNDQSTKKGYKGHPIIVFNTGKRGFMGETLSNCPDLIKLLKANLTTRTRSSVSSYLF